MPTAQEFLDRANVVKKSSEIPNQLTSQVQAKQVRAMIVHAQKQLRQIKSEIVLEMKSIRAEYEKKSTGAGSVGGTMLWLFVRKGLGKSYKAAAKRGVKKGRN